MTTVANPILPGCYPDPSIVRVEEDYYLVASTFEYFPGLPIFHSRDLVNWEQIGHAIDRPTQLNFDGIASSGGLYAPTIRHSDGLFWLVCTLVDQQDDDRGGNFVMTAPDPAGPWSDPVWFGAGGIDPSIFFDDDGRAWMHGIRLAPNPDWFHQTEVWIREFDLNTKQLTGPEHIVWNGALNGVVWSEAPHLYKVDGSYYLLTAEGGTEFHHAVSIAKADNVTGPYTGNKGNPILTHRHLGRGSEVVGVGHADLVEAADGSWWAVLLAMRTYGGYHYNLGRETFLVPVTWEDGWPVFAPGEGRVPTEVKVPFASGFNPGIAQGFTSGQVLPTDPRWTSLRRPATEFAAVVNDRWELQVTPASLVDPLTPAFLGIRQQHADADFKATLTDSIAPGEEAGLTIRQSENDHIRFFFSGDVTNGKRRVTAVARQAGIEKILGETELPSGHATNLTVSARGQDYALLASTPDTEPITIAVVDGRTLDTVATGGFLGLWVGAYATSNGAPTHSVVRLESFEYLPADR